MLQTHPRNEPISRRPFLFPFLFLYFSLLLLLSVLSYKYLIGVRKDATRRRERKRVLSELYLWGAECSHVENEEGTIKRYFNNTSSKLPIMVHARDDRPPRAEKLFHAESSGRDFFFFSPFFFFCVTRVLGHISPSWRYEYEVSTFRNGPRNCYVRWRTFQPRPRA